MDLDWIELLKERREMITRGAEPRRLKLGAAALDDLVTWFGVKLMPHFDYQATNIIASISSDEELKSALFYVGTSPRSHMFAQAATTNTTASLFCPIPMWGLKRDFDFLYENWDKSDPMLQLFLGASLAKALAEVPDSADIKHASESDLIKIREMSFEYRGVYSAKQHSSKHVAVKNMFPSTLDRKQLDKLVNAYNSSPSFIRAMLVQNWACHPRYRATDGSCILNPWNWDNIPPEIGVEATAEGGYTEQELFEALF